MPSVLTILTLFSALSFLFYGLSCLTSKRMTLEFERFGLTKQQQTLTGILQLIGGAGLVIGYYQSLKLAAISSTGLTVLMLLGFLVRLKIKDSLVLSAPSLVYALINLCLTLQFFGCLN
ncbi:MAG: putative membrane protein YphA (DoxX/SURF4 family) [Glaciecola sp.]|jgi:uncharacterized membrane protein YphA (DoxX/SURF4 family)